ncbi:MAG: glycosyltransferase family 4 protein [Mycobacteriaceae bacterium]|nr:glycosyltransferase family 4 protein [Mycobacteriaceae bacterium]
MDLSATSAPVHSGASRMTTEARRKRIAVTFIGINYEPEPLGIAPYSTGLCNQLAARGYDVRVITGVPHYPEWRIAPEYKWTWTSFETISGVPVKRVRHSIPKKFTNSRRLVMEATFGSRAALSKWDEPDVLICVTPALVSTALICLKNHALGRRRPALGVWVQDLYTVGLAETQTGGSAAAGIARRLESWVLRQADGVAVIHDRFRTQLLESLHVSPAKVRTIRNWARISSYASHDRNAAREQFGWAPDEIIVLHAGAMGVKQGLENVVRAAQIADQQNSRIRFVLLGDGNQRRSLEAMARGTWRLEIRDPLPDDKFAAALTAADILLVNQKPGVAEMSIPSKLISYFQSGTPVLAAIDSGSNAAEEIRNSGAGIIVESGDPVTLLDAAAALGADPNLRRRLGANGREYVTRVLSAEHSMDDFDNWVQQLLASRRR